MGKLVKRQVFCAIFAVFFAVLVTTTAKAADVYKTGKCGDNVTYTIYDDLTIVISGTGATYDYGTKTRPESPILTYLPELGMDYIIKAHTIKVEEGITRLGDNLFYSCYASNVELPSTLKSIGRGTFFSNSLKNITIPKAVTTIGESAFGANKFNNSLYIPENVKRVAKNSFDRAWGIQSKLSCGTYWLQPDGTAKVVAWYLNKSSSIVVPDVVSYDGKTYKVTSIEGSFNQLMITTSLKKLTIGKNVETISKRAFYKCFKLKNITIKSTVLKSVGREAFKGIAKNSVIKVPRAKLKSYKNILKKAINKNTTKIK